MTRMLQLTDFFGSCWPANNCERPLAVMKTGSCIAALAHHQMALQASRPVDDLLYYYDEAEQPGDRAKHDDYNVFGKDQ